MTNQVTRSLMAALAIAAFTTGCGQAPVGSAALQNAPTAQMDALATTTLLSGFKHIHNAVFTKLDANEDKSLDEYEASAGFDLKDFQKADKNKNHKLTKTEFMNYATADGLFGFVRQNKNDFLKQARTELLRSFTRLDANKDRTVTAKEMTEKALKGVNINLRIDALHVRVAILETDDAAFESSDKTGDGALTQAEFEDYAITHFIKLINPAYAYPPTPNQPAPTPEPAEPGTDEPAETW